MGPGSPAWSLSLRPELTLDKLDRVAGWVANVEMLEAILGGAVLLNLDPEPFEMSAPGLKLGSVDLEGDVTLAVGAVRRCRTARQ